MIGFIKNFYNSITGSEKRKEEQRYNLEVQRRLQEEISKDEFRVKYVSEGTRFFKLTPKEIVSSRIYDGVEDIAKERLYANIERMQMESFAKYTGVESKIKRNLSIEIAEKRRRAQIKKDLSSGFFLEDSFLFGGASYGN